jgi:hypothetical protein
VHCLDKLDRLGTEIFDADGNLRGFDLMMIAVVAITVVSFNAKSVMLWIGIKSKSGLAC